ncbi:calcium-binding protein SPEC 1A-like [Pecten maximus]|uniref:calcium-binding protein SPEC 1A-like n=1 Tax=Pecten maximus TaxID=6579 RepID=UPI0014586AD3|nr:calcium-binding protein SPEC 1A-like [Pecten maximus]
MQAYIRNAERKWEPIFRNIMRFRDSNDTDGPPGFTILELRDYIKEVLKKKISDDEVKDMFLDLDVDRQNHVTQTVFVKEMSKLPRQEAFQHAFDMQDYNRDGYLGVDEIKVALDMVGVSEERAMKFFKQVDSNKDGTISRKEFMKMV